MRPHPHLCSWISNLIVHTLLIAAVSIFLFGSDSCTCTGSLLNKVVIQSLNLTAAASSAIDASVWENNDFEISNESIFVNEPGRDWISSPERENLHSVFLSAKKTATLSTVLHNFNHTFLSVHFVSSIIGSIASSSKSTTPKTSAINPSSQNDTIVMSVEQRVASTNIQPTGQTATSSAPPSSATSEAVYSPSALAPSIITSTAIVGPNDSSGTHVIQITLEHLEPPQPAPVPTEADTSPASKKSNARVKRELDSQEISQVHEIFVKALSDSNKMAMTSDTDLDSSFTTASTLLPRDLSLSGQKTGEQEREHTQSEVRRGNLDDGQKEENSQDKAEGSQFGPGFYLLVNDHIVYDNWNGVRKTTNIMGSIIQSDNLWNVTNMLIEMDSYVLHRDVKISFHWNPIDSANYLLLNDIALGTLEGNPQTAVETLPEPVSNLTTTIPTTMASTQGTNVLHNNNITLVIVVKSQNHESDLPRNETSMDVGFLTMPALQTESDNVSNSTTVKNEMQSTREANNVTSSSKPQIILNRDPTLNAFSMKNSSNMAAIIVLCIVGVVILIICVGLIHRKLAAKNHQRGQC